MLLTKRAIIQELRSLQAVPLSAEWLKENKAILLYQIKSQIEQPVLQSERRDGFALLFTNYLAGFQNFVNLVAVVINRYRRVCFDHVLASVMMFMIVLGFGSNHVVGSAMNSIPGDRLYGVKILVEKTQLLMTANKQDETMKQVEFVQNRIDEIKQLSHSSPVVEKNVEVATDSLENSLAFAKDRLGSFGKNDAKIVKAIENKTSEYATSLKKARQVLVSTDQKTITAKKIEIVLDKTNQVNNSALKVMALNLASNTNINANSEAENDLVVELAGKVETKIQDTENRLSNLDKKMLPVVMAVNDPCKGAQSEQVVKKNQENSQEAKDVLVKAKKHLRDQDYFAAIENLEFSQNIVKRVEVSVADEVKCEAKTVPVDNPESSVKN